MIKINSIQLNKLIMPFAILLGITLQSYAQPVFNPGNGSDGAYLATSNTTLSGGTYNFTNFTIQPGVVVTVTGTAPLVIRCTGSALIDGQLMANGGDGGNGITYVSGGIPGIGVAGGSNGGDGSFSASLGPLDGQDGVGDGGVGNKGKNWSGGGGAGYANSGSSASVSNGIGGPAYGDAILTTLPGGSGGGGGSGGYNCGAGGGGAGGGLIVINAAVSLTVNGSISCNGGNGGSDAAGNCGGGGAGSGGSIWLAAPAFVHTGLLSAIGGNGGASSLVGSPYFGVGANGSEGRIRVDYDGPLITTGTNNPPIGYHTSVNIALPAVISEFSGSMKDNINTLHWTSLNELNNDYYILQFSRNAEDFETIAEVKSKSFNGNSESNLLYRVNHTNPVIGHNYYRLQQKDYDGRIHEVSKVIDIIRDNLGNTLSVFPNPSNQEITLNLFTNKDRSLTLHVIDMQGKIVKHSQANTTSGQLSLSMDIQNLSRGNYIVHLFDQKGFSVKKIITKQ